MCSTLNVLHNVDSSNAVLVLQATLESISQSVTVSWNAQYLGNGIGSSRIQPSSSFSVEDSPLRRYDRLHCRRVVDSWKN